MWACLNGSLAGNGIAWRKSEEVSCAESEFETGVRIILNSLWTHEQPSRLQALKAIAAAIQRESNFDWLTVDSLKSWTIDLSKLRTFIGKAGAFDYLNGQLTIEPELEIVANYSPDSAPVFIASVVCIVTRESVKPASVIKPPPVICESLKRFQGDYPDPGKVAFIMMRFGETAAHDLIAMAIRKVLATVGMVGLRADDKHYHDDLFPNVQTYLHGCGFGIAVFERIESERFNPNVGLEIGYMLAMEKPICYLKDKSLTSLQTDLIGKLYRTFDTYQPHDTISKELEAWLTDKGVLGSSAGNA